MHGVPHRKAGLLSPRVPHYGGWLRLLSPYGGGWVPIKSPQLRAGSEAGRCVQAASAGPCPSSVKEARWRGRICDHNARNIIITMREGAAEGRPPPSFLSQCCARCGHVFFLAIALPSRKTGRARQPPLPPTSARVFRCQIVSMAGANGRSVAKMAHNVAKMAGANGPSVLGGALDLDVLDHAGPPSRGGDLTPQG